jgi:hypothetical protein
MLHEGREIISVLYNIDKENEGYNYVSWWFDVCRIGFKTFGERLTLDDVVVQDEATQTGAGDGPNRAINEHGSSSR